MKLITEEQQQSLIADCKADIEHLEIKLTDCNKGEFEDTVSLLLRQQIALASLTAEPTHYIFNHPTGKLFNALVDESCKYHKDVHPGYTAPPAPVIKLPDELTDLVNAVDFYNAVKAENPKVETGTWKDADEWIKRAAVTAAPLVKRLNGLED